MRNYELKNSIFTTMHIKNLLLVLALAGLISCGKKYKDYQPVNEQPELHKVEVLEVQDAGNYTYLLAKEGDREYWMAIDRTEVSKGEVLYYRHFIEMKDFKSKELDREFASILFVDGASRDPNDTEPETPPSPAQIPGHDNLPKVRLVDSIRIEPAAGGLSIAEVYARAAEYKNKKVLVRGKVTKVNNDIMNRNWVHLMDGTRGDRDDLTFTTQAVIQVGDTVTLEGTLAIDKEYGVGYTYPLIVEDAELK